MSQPRAVLQGKTADSGGHGSGLSVYAVDLSLLYDTLSWPSRTLHLSVRCTGNKCGIDSNNPETETNVVIAVMSLLILLHCLPK